MSSSYDSSDDSDDFKHHLFDFEDLDKDNYHNWNWQMQAPLRKYHLWGLVDGSTPCPLLNESSPEAKKASEGEIREWMMKDAQATCIIERKLSERQQLSIEDCTTAKEVWDELRRIHLETDVAWKVFKIMQDMTTRKYVEGTPVLDHTLAFEVDYLRLRCYKRDIGDEMLAILIVLSLPPTKKLQNFFINPMEEWDRTGKLESKEVISRLQKWEDREQLLARHRQSRASSSTWCTYHKSNTHNTEDCRALARKQASRRR